LDRGTAEALLRGARQRAAAAPDALVRLLSAATAPARPFELVDEETAVAAFRQSRRPRVHTSGRRALLARLLTVKVTAAFALTAVGGAAVATSGDLTKIPGTADLIPGTTDVAPHPAVPPVTSAPVPTAATPRTDLPASSPRPPSTRPAPSARPDPESLCRSLLADSRARALDSQALARLINLAGGQAAEVWAYCARMLSSAGGGKPPAWSQPPAGAGRGTGGTGQPRDTYRTFSTDPYDWRSFHPRPQQERPPQHAVQTRNAQRGPQTAGRGTSPRPGSRPAHPSSLRVGRR
jgi:hypothetical protein